VKGELKAFLLINIFNLTFLGSSTFNSKLSFAHCAVSLSQGGVTVGRLGPCGSANCHAMRDFSRAVVLGTATDFSSYLRLRTRSVHQLTLSIWTRMLKISICCLPRLLTLSVSDRHLGPLNWLAGRFVGRLSFSRVYGRIAALRFWCDLWLLGGINVGAASCHINHCSTLQCNFAQNAHFALRAEGSEVGSLIRDNVR